MAVSIAVADEGHLGGGGQQQRVASLAVARQQVARGLRDAGLDLLHQKALAQRQQLGRRAPGQQAGLEANVFLGHHRTGGVQRRHLRTARGHGFVQYLLVDQESHPQRVAVAAQQRAVEVEECELHGGSGTA